MNHKTVDSRLSDRVELRTFRAARAQRLYEEVVSQVMDLIATGELVPGSRLPPERELTGQMGVSRNVLREAFRVLEERGIIAARPGDGRYVRDATPAEHRTSADPVGQLELASILDVLEVRELIETQVVALACARITPSEVQRLRDAAKRMKDWRDNLDFHVTLAATTHNYMLERLVREQLEVLQDVHQRQHYVSADRGPHLLREHEVIAEAVVARDVAAAQRLMRRHFAHTRQSLTGGLEAGAREEGATT